MIALSDRALDHLRGVVRESAVPAIEWPPRYRGGRELGRGGMGVVYRVHDVELARDVALKVLSDELGEQTSAGWAERMLREARILARLEHPGIVPVHDVGVLPDGRRYYTMKRVEGRRLDHYCQDEPSLNARLRLFLRVCEAVSFAHAQRVVHRDLKPSNIMVGPFGEVLVMDWGIAKVRRRGGDSDRDSGAERAARSNEVAAGRPSEAGPARVAEPATTVAFEGPPGVDPIADSGILIVTRPGAVLGTPGYMAPEQERGDRTAVDERSDIYSLGVVLREISRDGDPAAPARLAAIAAHAMSEDPDDRYPTVEALRSDVSRFLDGEPVSVYRETLYERGARFGARHAAAITLLAVYLLVRILILLFSGA